jgi:hypothetical protein
LGGMYQHFTRNSCPHLQARKCYFALNMKAAVSFRTLVNIYKTIGHHTLEDSKLFYFPVLRYQSYDKQISHSHLCSHLQTVPPIIQSYMLIGGLSCF